MNHEHQTFELDLNDPVDLLELLDWEDLFDEDPDAQANYCRLTQGWSAPENN